MTSESVKDSFPSLPRIVRLLLLFSLLVYGIFAFGQPARQPILVEHFTNTRCSICAGRNPGFYTTLRQQPDVLHIAYHPSSPYATCALNRQNPAENDARTHFYGIYGATPRLVINGSVIPAGQNYADAALYTPFQGQLSPFEVSVLLTAQGTDSLRATVQLTTLASHTYSNLTLYLPLLEDTIFYAAPNGETQHYDVFRRSFTGAAPLILTPATGAGNTVTVSRALALNPLWNNQRLYALAIIQDAGRTVIQSAASAHFTNTPNGLPELPENTFEVYPNPAHNELRLSQAGLLPFWIIRNALGQVVLQRESQAAQLDISPLPPGAYVLQAQRADGVLIRRRFVKQ